MLLSAGFSDGVELRTFKPANSNPTSAGTAHIMALSANMAAAGAGGTGIAVTGGMAFGGNAMATPQTFSSSFRPPPSGHGGPNDSCCGGGGGGGAYDLRALEREEEPEEDLHACLGVDIGTSTIKVRLCCQPSSNGSIVGCFRHALRVCNRPSEITHALRRVRTCIGCPELLLLRRKLDGGSRVSIVGVIRRRARRWGSG